MDVIVTGDIAFVGGIGGVPGKRRDEIRTMGLAVFRDLESDDEEVGVGGDVVHVLVVLAIVRVVPLAVPRRSELLRKIRGSVWSTLGITSLSLFWPQKPSRHPTSTLRQGRFSGNELFWT